MEMHWKSKMKFKIYYLLFLGCLLMLIITLANNRDIYGIPKKEYKSIQLILQDSTNYKNKTEFHMIIGPVTKQHYHYDSISKWEDIHR